MNEDMSLPARGDHMRGWRHHWRRGLVGSLQDWAQGRKFRIIFMLAELAKKFNVMREVISIHAAPPPEVAVS